MIFKLIIWFTLIFATVHCGNVIFEDCGSAYELDSVQIEGCERSVPCYLAVDELINVTATYNAGFVSVSLVQDVFVVLNSIQRETYVSPQACEATWCPVDTTNVSLYEARFKLPTNVALNTRGHLHWQLYNEENTKVICFTIIIQTKSYNPAHLESAPIND